MFGKVYNSATHCHRNGDGLGDIKELKLIADLVINHSSDEHLWFNKSIDRIHPYTDFYVWIDPKGYDQDGKTDSTKILVAEAYTSDNHTIAYYGTDEYPITHFPFNFKFIEFNSFRNASSYNEPISNWFENYAERPKTTIIQSRQQIVRRVHGFDDHNDNDVARSGVPLLRRRIGMINGKVRADQRKTRIITASPELTEMARDYRCSGMTR
ncbi:Alpha amylase, catalytic domain [Sarracenia purpurea var. burkii]